MNQLRSFLIIISCLSLINSAYVHGMQTLISKKDTAETPSPHSLIPQNSHPSHDAPAHHIDIDQEEPGCLSNTWRRTKKLNRDYRIGQTCAEVTCGIATFAFVFGAYLSHIGCQSIRERGGHC